MMEFTVFNLLYGLSYGLLLFMLSSGLTLIFSMMGVLSFAHGSFYMLGAYFAFTISAFLGFWPAFFIAPICVGLVGGGCALAGLAGVVGGAAFVTTSPSMGIGIGSLTFAVIIIWGMGSYMGALVAPLLMGIIQTVGVALDYSLGSVLNQFGVDIDAHTFAPRFLHMTVAQIAPIMPYLLMILILLFRPMGLMGTRED